LSLLVIGFSGMCFFCGIFLMFLLWYIFWSRRFDWRRKTINVTIKRS